MSTGGDDDRAVATAEEDTLSSPKADDEPVDDDIDALRSRVQTKWADLRKHHEEKAVQRPEAESKAMPWWTRMRTRIRGYARTADEGSPSEQYRIPPPENENLWDALTARRGRRRKRFVSLASFHMLMLHFLVVYFVVISLFALFMQIFVRIYYDAGQECVTNYDYSRVSISNTDNYLVLFGLSWTTFSTVGFGVIGLSTESGCQAFRYFLAIEAFVGIMYSGYSGALIFSNISGYLARAHVTFSSSICLQYGNGLVGPRVTFRKTGKERAIGNEGEWTAGHCPVLEMRLVNDRVGKGAAISNGYLQCLAVMSEDMSNDVSPSSDETVHDRLTFQINDGDDSPGVGDVKIETCCELEVFPNSMPYFSHGSWYFSHNLDENSPLLKDSVRARIRENGGKWPSDLNDHGKIRSCFSKNVNYIAVVMKGTSSLTAGGIFKSYQYYMEDVYIGFRFAELGYIPHAKGNVAHNVGYDLSLVNDITPQHGGGNEPLGSRADQDDSSSRSAALSEDAVEVDRHYVWRRGHRRNYDRLMRSPEETRPMKSSLRKWTSLSSKIRRCFRKNATGESCQQYRIPPREEKSHFFRHGIISEHPIIMCTLWLYQTTLFRALLSFLLGYFVLIWLFALLLYAVDPSCLSGWEYVSGRFIESFYIVFQVSYATLSTVGYGAVAPEAGEPCRGLSLILAAEAFIGVIYNSFCGAIFYAKISRTESIADISFSTAACLQYEGGDTATKLEEVTNDSKASGGCAGERAPYPFLEMRVLNEDAQYRNMKGQILNASIKCFATSFKLSRVHDSSNDSEKDVDYEQATAHRSFDKDSNLQWKRICDELKIIPSRQVVFAKTPWTFRHILDGASPLLKPEVRERVKELGYWPPDLSNHEQLRSCLSPDVNAVHVLFKGTSNRTANSVFQVHEYRPEDIFVGWKFAGLGYVVEKKSGDETKYEVKFDRCLLNDILPQSSEKAEPLHALSEDDDDQDD